MDVSSSVFLGFLGAVRPLIHDLELSGNGERQEIDFGMSLDS